MMRFEIRARGETWALHKPFVITGHRFESLPVLLVEVASNGHVGRGEAAGVYYLNDRPSSMLGQIQAIAGRIQEGLSRHALAAMLPRGGARNALDCALWDLEAKLNAKPAWQLAGLKQTKPLLTTYTCGAAAPREMAATARGYRSAKALKLKLVGDGLDADRVAAVRDAVPEAWIGVDANQGFTLSELDLLMATFQANRIELIEQPLPAGGDDALSSYQSPIPLAADESFQDITDLARIAGKYSVVNIKLDKCGGLSEAIAIAQAAPAFGLRPMVGNMLGTSLAMAPASIVGQMCAIVDLDGPILLRHDRPDSAQYIDGCIDCASVNWGEAV